MNIIKNVKWLGAVVLTASIGYGSVALAQNAEPNAQKQHQRREHMKEFATKMKQQLGLTDQQVAQIKQIRENNKATMQADRQAIKSAAKGSDAQKAAFAKAKQDRQAVKAQINNVLTDAQKQKLAELQAQRKQQWQQHKGQHQGERQQKQG